METALRREYMGIIAHALCVVRNLSQRFLALTHRLAISSLGFRTLESANNQKLIPRPRHVRHFHRRRRKLKPQLPFRILLLVAIQLAGIRAYCVSIAIGVR